MPIANFSGKYRRDAGLKFVAQAETPIERFTDLREAGFRARSAMLRFYMAANAMLPRLQPLSLSAMVNGYCNFLHDVCQSANAAESVDRSSRGNHGRPTKQLLPVSNIHLSWRICRLLKWTDRGEDRFACFPPPTANRVRESAAMSWRSKRGTRRQTAQARAALPLGCVLRAVQE